MRSCENRPLHPFLAELPKLGCSKPALVFKIAAKESLQLPSPEIDLSYKSPENLAKRFKSFRGLTDFS
jgi:hypothetical protein